MITVTAAVAILTSGDTKGIGVETGSLPGLFRAQRGGVEGAGGGGGGAGAEVERADVPPMKTGEAREGGGTGRGGGSSLISLSMSATCNVSSSIVRL